MTEEQPDKPDLDLTAEDIAAATATARMMERLSMVDDIAKRNDFTKTRACLREKEPKIDIQAIGQLFQEVMTDYDRVKSDDKSFRKETLDGLRERVEKIKYRLDKSHTFFTKDLLTAVEDDGHTQIMRARDIKDKGTMRAVAEDTKTAVHATLDAATELIELMRFHWMLESRINIMQDFYRQVDSPSVRPRRIPPGESKGRGL